MWNKSEFIPNFHAQFSCYIEILVMWKHFAGHLTSDLTGMSLCNLYQYGITSSDNSIKLPKKKKKKKKNLLPANWQTVVNKVIILPDIIYCMQIVFRL